MADQHARQCFSICDSQVRLCLARRDYVRAQILIRKVSARAFAERPDKKGQAAGEVGIEGTTIEEPDVVSLAPRLPIACLANCKAGLCARECQSVYAVFFVYDAPYHYGSQMWWQEVLDRGVTTCWHQIRYNLTVSPTAIAISDGRARRAWKS